MFRFDDNSREAQRWRMQQMIANNAIEGTVSYTHLTLPTICSV